jgi:hypothetical protein
VQSTSIDKTIQVLRGFLGFCHNLMGTAMADLGLWVFTDPELLAWFLAFLQARGVGREQIIKQISVARKVADFLKAEAHDDPATDKHVADLDRWLQRLSSQLSALLPSPDMPVLPESHKLRRWSETTLSEAGSLVRQDLAYAGAISKRTATFVQQAVVIGFVVGTALPPLRLDFLKTVPHPKFNHLGCMDPDCLLRACGRACRGNRLNVRGGGIDSSPTVSDEEADEAEWESRYASARSSPLAPGTVSLGILHGKNDRRPNRSSYQLEIPVPSGPTAFSECLLVHIRAGRPLLTQEGGEDNAKMRLFVTCKSGMAFSDVTFVQFWHKAMRDTRAEAFGVPPFPPSKGRSSFVEAFTDLAGGVEPEFREGASAIMGNTPSQWNASYNPSRRQRSADAAIGIFGAFAARQRTME